MLYRKEVEPTLAVSAREAARMLSIGQTKLRELCKTGQLNPIYLFSDRGPRKFLVSELKKFLATKERSNVSSRQEERRVHRDRRKHPHRRQPLRRQPNQFGD